MVKRYIDLSRLGEDEERYHYGTYCLENMNEVHALLAAVWQFGVYKQNYRTELIKKDEED